MSSISITFFAYGLTAIVSILVAVLIKFMTTVLSRIQQSAQAQVPAARQVPAAVTSETDIAVIAAAVYTAMGNAVRIVRIEERTGRGVLWVASGRFVHRQPHVLTSRPPYQAM